MVKYIQSAIPYIRPHKLRLILSIIFSLFLGLIKGAQIYLIKPIFDKGLNPNYALIETLEIVGILLLLALIHFPIRFYHFFWIRSVEESAMAKLREDIFFKFQKLPMNFFSLNKQGNLISNLFNDTTIYAQGFRSIIDLIREPFSAVIMLAIAIWHDWQLTTVMILVTPIFLLIFRFTGKKVKENQKQVQIELSEMTHSASEGIYGQKISKAFNLQKYNLNRFLNKQNSFLSAKLKTTIFEEIAHPMVEIIGALAFSIIILFAYYRINSGQLSIGGFISFITAIAMIMDPIRKYSQANLKLNQAITGLDRIFPLLKNEEENLDIPKSLETFTHSIEFENLTFSYEEGEKVIQDFNLKINKGQKVAIVGLSGSGKSTIINLLLGLYPIKNGDIKIDGKSIKDMSLVSLRSYFALVSQDIFLFNDTIHENITTGKKINQQQLNSALNISFANEFINKLPDGIHTEIGDRGTILSGGQKQRLTIARAFIHENDILLFDEATSALDNESEKMVQKALDKISSTKTVIAVAHRLSTISHFDNIVVLKDGKIEEQGTHEILMQKKSVYSKLYNLSLKN